MKDVKIFMQKREVSKVLVLGSSGVVGHGISSNLVEHNFNVIGTSHKKKLNCKSKKFLNYHNVNFNKTNSIQKIKKIIKDHGIQAIINCAILHPNKSFNFKKSQIYNVNYKMVLKILNLSLKNNLQFFINLGGHSLKEKLKEKNLSKIQKLYFHTKYIVEKKILSIKTPKTRVISLNIIAPYGFILDETSVVPKFINHAKQGKDINIFSDGKRKQYFTFSEDIGSACRYIFKKNLSGPIPFAGSSAITTKHLAKTIIKVVGKKKIRLFVNKKIKDKDGIAVKNYIKEKKLKKTLLIKRHNLKQSLKKILKNQTQIKIKKK